MVTIAVDISIRLSRKMSRWKEKGDRPLVARLNLSKLARRSMARKSIWFLIRMTAPSRDRQSFHLFNDVTPAGVGNIAHSRKYREKRKPGGQRPDEIDESSNGRESVRRGVVDPVIC